MTLWTYQRQRCLPPLEESYHLRKSAEQLKLVEEGREGDFDSFYDGESLPKGL